MNRKVGTVRKCMYTAVCMYKNIFLHVQNFLLAQLNFVTYSNIESVYLQNF